MAVLLRVHHFEVGPVVGLTRGCAGHRTAPPEMNAGRHENLRVRDGQFGLPLKLHDVQAAEGVHSVGTGELKAVPAVVGHIRGRHDFHALLRRGVLGAGGAVLEDHGARGGVHDADAEGHVLPCLTLEEGIGAHVARREVDAIDEDGSFGMSPVYPRTCHLVARPVAVELAVVARRPDGVHLRLPIKGLRWQQCCQRKKGQ